MSARAVRIYTKTGDGGKSSLFNGDRVEKDHLVFHALGDVDELNSVLGVAYAHLETKPAISGDLNIGENLLHLQSRLLDLGSAIATPTNSTEAAVSRTRFPDTHALHLEGQIDAMERHLDPLRNFILPGGGMAASSLHHARSVCRRAERSVTPLVRDGQVQGGVQVFLNRLSDWLFVAARFTAKTHGHQEIVYKKE